MKFAMITFAAAAGSANAWSTGRGTEYDPSNPCMFDCTRKIRRHFRCIDACAASDRANFFEANLDQWLGVGSSEENCFEWNVQVSRHDLLPTPLSLSRALALLRVRVCSRIA